MSTISTVGPISGINYGALITGLTGVDQVGIDNITSRISTLQNQDTALTDINTLITGLKLSAASFLSSAIFRATAATSANPSIINATGGIGTPTGNYSFSVQRLAAASQQVTQGFSDPSTALGLSGTFTIQTGGGRVDDVASLSSLNGGNGVARGSIRITDASGASTLVDLSKAVDVNDVVTAINSATGVSVTAKVDGDHLDISDTSGGAGSLKVANTGGTTTASDLGLTTTAASGVVTGSSLTKLSSGTNLNSLNDGNGVRTSSGVDFTIAGAGGPFSVSLNGDKTIADVVKSINTVGGTAGVTAAISADGGGITLTDTGGGPITVTSATGSLAAYDLGLTGVSSTGGTFVGNKITNQLSGPLLTDLNGGNQGTGSTIPTPGIITVAGQSIDLSSARSLDDVINGINTNTHGITAAVNSAGTGIVLTSASGTPFTVADSSGNLASFLHIAGTSAATASGSQLSSNNLHLRYVSNNTLLSTLNAGNGVTAGKIQITDGNAQQATIDLSSKSITSVGDVLSAINNSGLAVKASINSTGDGILLTQTGGTGTASVSESNGGTTASQLGILGNFTNGSLNGSFEKTITVGTGDTLSDIATKINNLNIGASASIINDGSSGSPYRLSISSRNSGFAGRVVFDASGGTTGITTTSLVQGQDAVLVYGGNANGTGGLLTTNSTNTITGLIPSLTLNLTGVGQSSVAVTGDTSKISTAVQSFVDSYNGVINGIATATAFNQANPSANGILFGNSVVQQVQEALGSFVNQTYSGYGSITSLASIGITVGQDGTLSLDSDALNTALATDPTDIQKIFTQNTLAVAGGSPSLNGSTLLSTLVPGQTFPGGHISITDGFGTAYDIDLSTGVSTLADVIAKINSTTNGTITAGINATGDGLLLTQVGGTQTPQVSEVNGGTTASFLNIKGSFIGGSLNGQFPATLPSNAVKGIGATLSDVVARFNDAQTGILFDATQAIESQETQLTDRQTALTTLLNTKKQQLLTQFANLESTIAGLQAQGTAIAGISSTTSSTSSTTKSTA